MGIQSKPRNVITLKQALPQAEKGGYAIGAFAPRYTSMIRPILRAGQKNNSPLIVQISQKEMDRTASPRQSLPKSFTVSWKKSGSPFRQFSIWIIPK